jgi:hypothetical protein
LQLRVPRLKGKTAVSRVPAASITVNKRSEDFSLERRTALRPLPELPQTLYIPTSAVAICDPGQEPLRVPGLSRRSITVSVETAESVSISLLKERFRFSVIY